MRSTRRLFTSIALLTLAIAAGCDTPSAKAAPGEVATGIESAEQQLQQAGRHAKEAAQATKDKAYALRARFVKDMQSDLGRLNGTLQQLSDKVESSNNAAKAEAKVKLATLRDKVARINVELEKAKHAQDTSWNELQAGFERSNKDLRDSVAQARTWLSEKIAP